MPALVDVCPSCHGELAGRIAQHCGERSKPCGWLKHSCDEKVRAVVDPRRGRYYLETVSKA